MPLHKNQVIQLAVESISNDGNGVGRYEGQAVFVPFSAVGDLLRVKIVKATKSYAFGRIEQIITPGKGRIEPACPIAGKCGGCSFAHLAYEAELEAKQSFIEDTLKRIGGLNAAVEPILPSPLQSGYRNKMQVPVSADGSGGLLYGFYAGRSHRIVPAVHCELQPAQLNKIAAGCAEVLNQLGIPAYDETLHKGLLRHIYLREGYTTGEVMLCLVAAKARLPREYELVELLTAAFPSIATILVNHNPDKTNVICGKQNRTLFGLGYIRDTLCGVPLRLDPLSFSQVNSLAAEKLFELVAHLASPAKEDVLLDLYCGAGVIGLSMASQCKQLIGVEIVPEAIRNAKTVALEMGLSNTRFITSNAGSAAINLANENLHPDIIIVDPPRKGCDEATLSAILTMAPARIVMVSCNPATMARDLAALSSGGYTVSRVCPADLFPRTKHVECACLLIRQ